MPDNQTPQIRATVPHRVEEYLAAHDEGRTVQQFILDLGISQPQVSKALCRLEAQGRARRERARSGTSRPDVWFPHDGPAPDPKATSRDRVSPAIATRTAKQGGSSRLHALLSAAEQDTWAHPSCAVPDLGAGTCHDSDEAAEKRRKEAVAALECAILTLALHDPEQTLRSENLASVLVSTVGNVLVNQIADTIAQWAEELARTQDDDPAPHPTGQAPAPGPVENERAETLHWAAHKIRGLVPVLDLRR